MGRRILGFHYGYETYFFILVHDKHNMNILNSPTSRETRIRLKQFTLGS